MSIPQVPEQVRRAPLLALRAVFAGIGRILMSADRTDASSAGAQQAGGADSPGGPGLEQRQLAARREAQGQLAARQQRPARGRQRSRTAVAPEPISRWRSLDQTGNVRLLTADDNQDGDDVPPVAAGSAPAAGTPGPAPAATPGPAPAATPGPAPAATPAPLVTPAPALTPAAADVANGPALPLASYDTLTLASIRARLRGLDVPQLKILLDYEVTHAERPEVLGMFERRIEKLESGG
jgi:hypothetical protein